MKAAPTNTMSTPSRTLTGGRCTRCTRCAPQFLHVKSGKWLCARPRKVSVARKDHIMLELDPLGDAHSAFVILPRYKHRQYDALCSPKSSIAGRRR